MLCRHALQLRQAKLAFPSVYLMVGVFSDDDCRQHGSPAIAPHVERCEVVRHCRWVDEVIGDAPWQLNDAFILGRRIDYVAIDEGTSVDPACLRTTISVLFAFVASDFPRTTMRSPPLRPCNLAARMSGRHTG